MKDLNGKVVVVTGGSAGLGRAIAREFARRGARVGVLARGPERLAQTEDELRALGASCLTVQTDVSDPQAVEHAAELVERQLGPIDVWVNNAMTTVFSRADKLTAKEFQRVTAVTYLGAVNGTLTALRRMRPRGHGAILQVGSALAYRAIPLQSAYCGAKHGLRGFTDSVRCELMHDKIPIQVTSVHMPGLNTPQFDWCESHMPRKAQPVGAVFQPEVGARAVIEALESGRRELYVGWPTFKAVLGNKLVPRYADRRAARDAYEPQMSPEPEDPARRGNLFQYVAADVAARGRFDDRARPRSAMLWVSAHRNLLLTMLGAAVTGAAVWSRSAAR